MKSLTPAATLSTLGGALALYLCAPYVSAQSTMRVNSDAAPATQGKAPKGSDPTKGSAPKHLSPQLRSQVSSNSCVEMPKPGTAMLRPQYATSVVVPVASGTWKVSRPGFVSYCVSAGVVNTSQNVSPAGLVLSLTDIRKVTDTSYAQEFDTTPRPMEHKTVPSQNATFAQQIPAEGSMTVANPWCVNQIEWKRRPQLQLTLVVPKSGHGDVSTITCAIEFPDK